jgi:hypothetical protein
LPDLFKMSAHGLAGRSRITPPDGGEKLFVVILTSLRAALDQKNAFALLS